MICFVVWKTRTKFFFKDLKQHLSLRLVLFNYVWKTHEFVFLNLGKLHVTYLVASPYKRRASSKRRSVGEWLMSEAIVIIKSISIFILNEPSERATSNWDPFWHILFLITKLYFSWKADFSQYLEEKDKSRVDVLWAFLDVSLWRLCRKSVTQGKKT